MLKIDRIEALQTELQGIRIGMEDRVDMARDLMALLRDACDVKSLSWRTYTPSFNDGDPCTMGLSYGMFLTFTTDGEEDDDDDEEEDEGIPLSCFSENLKGVVKDSPLGQQMDALTDQYEKRLDLLVAVNKVKTNTEFTYTWQGDVLVETQAPYNCGW